MFVLCIMGPLTNQIQNTMKEGVKKGNTEQTSYDVVVVGAGSGGLTSAVGFKNIGKSVLLIEREHMGGECTNTGCIPSKALLHHAKNYHKAKLTAGDTQTLETYRNSVFSEIRSTIDGILEHETPDVFKEKGIDVVMGEAIFTGVNTVSVNDTEYSFKKSVIATGSSPRMTDIPGLQDSHLLTNQNVFEQDAIPENLLVIGSGPIGMELGQAFAMLGSNVTIATIDTRFARLEDELISPIIEKEFTDLGVTILKSAYTNKIENGTAHIDIKDGDVITETKQVAFDKVLLAIGRVPNIPQGLDTAGIEFTKHGVTTNNHHQTTNKNIFAVGDVALRLKFTHTADDAARHVVKKVLLPFVRAEHKKEVPKVTFTLPAVAAVGMSFDDAVSKYGENKVVKITASYKENDRAITDKSTENGLAVLVVKKVSGKILGANIIGQSSGEILSFFTLAIEHNITLWKINKLIFPYPTISLIIKKLSDKFLAYQLGNLKSDLINYLK